MIRSKPKILMAVLGPLNQSDIFRIACEFDQRHFNTVKPLRKDQVDRIVVMNQWQRMLSSADLPIEIIHEIMMHHLNNEPSVSTLLMAYRNTAALKPEHRLPLANDLSINNASRSLLLQLGQTTPIGHLACFQQLMADVFRNHFSQLTLDQKIELSRRSHISTWEQRSPNQKLALLERIQAPTIGGRIKFEFQLLSWKIQLTAAKALEKGIIPITIALIMLAYVLISVTLALLKRSSYIAASAIFKAIEAKWAALCFYGLIGLVAVAAISLTLSLIGRALTLPIFPNHLREKGAWISSVGFKSFLLMSDLLLLLLSQQQASHQNNGESLYKTSLELQKLLLESINKANITIDQNRFVEAYLPELLEKWHQLTAPSMVQALDQG